jgi:Predicted periplasmic ligand-binding sensor domain
MPYYMGEIQFDSKNRLWGVIDYSLSGTWISPSPHFFIFDGKQTTQLSCGNDIHISGRPQITIDTKDNIWCFGIGTASGVWIDEQWKQFDNSALGGLNPWIIKEDPQGMLWFGTENGIYIQPTQ